MVQEKYIRIHKVITCISCVYVALSLLLNNVEVLFLGVSGIVISLVTIVKKDTITEAIMGRVRILLLIGVAMCITLNMFMDDSFVINYALLYVLYYFLFEETR